jgi:putative transport protein
LEIFPYPGLHIQVGDIIQCVGPENAVKRLALRLGNQTKSLDTPNLVAIFLGITLGVFIGSIPIAMPGMPTPLKLGLAGGPLIVAILLGRFGATFHLATYTTNSANLIVRELGIALFLASVGLTAGGNFVNTLVNGNGLLYAFCGFIITFVPQFVVGFVARYFFKVNYHSVVGLLTGACTNSPILAYAATLSDKSAAAVAYSTVYPLAMFLRIITGQIIIVALWAYVTL